MLDSRSHGCLWWNIKGFQGLFFVLNTQSLLAAQLRLRWCFYAQMHFVHPEVHEWCFLNSHWYSLVEHLIVRSMLCLKCQQQSLVCLFSLLFYCKLPLTDRVAWLSKIQNNETAGVDRNPNSVFMAFKQCKKRMRETVMVSLSKSWMLLSDCLIEEMVTWCNRIRIK